MASVLSQIEKCRARSRGRFVGWLESNGFSGTAGMESRVFRRKLSFSMRECCGCEFEMMVEVLVHDAGADWSVYAWRSSSQRQDGRMATLCEKSADFDATGLVNDMAVEKLRRSVSEAIRDFAGGFDMVCLDIGSFMGLDWKEVV